MENESIEPRLSRVYVALRQQMEAIQTLTLGLMAVREVLKHDPKFEQQYAEKYVALQSGELGTKFAQDRVAFDQVLGIWMSGQS